MTIRTPVSASLPSDSTSPARGLEFEPSEVRKFANPGSGTDAGHGQASELALVKGIFCNLKYVSWQFADAIPHPWLQAALIEKLHRVDWQIRQATDAKGRLLIWDALRDFKTQEDIFRREYGRIFQLYPGKSYEEIHAMVSTKVRAPRVDIPPPHTTGGAVDVTIWIDDQEDVLGTFDDFSDRGRSDFFCPETIKTEQDRRAAELRAVLRSAMLAEDFVGIDEEWWHYEFGTRYWATTKSRPVIFDSILKAPETDSVALRSPRTPSRQLQISTGVAQVFPTALDRSRSLRGEVDGHYYARTRHPNERQVADKLRALIGGSEVTFCPSGLSAVLAAVMAYAPINAKILLDKFVYYETEKSLREIGSSLGWKIDTVDMSDGVSISWSTGKEPNVILVDHPRNWRLDCPDLKQIRSAILRANTTLIVDTSVQPLQRLLDLNLADIVVLSLSKYPSLGETTGGAIIGSKTALSAVRNTNAILGNVLAPEAAATVLKHLRTLPITIEWVSESARKIVRTLNEIPFISDVRLPELSNVGARSGGQISFRVSPAIAERAEQIIAANTIDENFPLALACTFGASFTTFEHFHSRNDNNIASMNGSTLIENGRIRLGIGLESANQIIDALRFVLYAAKTC